MATATTRTNGNGGENTALARRQDSDRTVRDLFIRSKDQIAMALPSHLKPDRMIRVALTTIRQTPKLLECTPISLLKCVMQASALGLEPDPLLGRCYMVPFRDTKKGITEATLIIGYKGLIDLARRSGEIVSLEAHVVYERDEFRFEFGSGECLIHRPGFMQDRGQITHAWAMARFKGGGHQFEVMDYWELEAVRGMSKQGNFGPWVDHRAEMYRKTVVRRLAKFLPLSPQLVSHLAGEEMVDSGMSPGEVYGDADEMIETTATVTTTSKAAGLTERLKPAETPKDLGWVHGEKDTPKREADESQDGDDLDGLERDGQPGMSE